MKKLLVGLLFASTAFGQIELRSGGSTVDTNGLASTVYVDAAVAGVNAQVTSLSNISCEVVLTNVTLENVATFTFYPSNYVSQSSGTNDLLKIYYRGLQTSRTDAGNDQVPITLQGGGANCYSGEAGGYSIVTWSGNTRSNAWFFPSAAAKQANTDQSPALGELLLTGIFNNSETKGMSGFGVGKRIDTGLPVAQVVGATLTNNPTVTPWIQFTPRFGTSFWAKMTFVIVRLR